MKMELYAIKDELANNFMPPIEFKSSAEAERTFKYLINDKSNSIMYSCPEDYSLWKIGTIEKTTGKLTSELEKIVNGKLVKDIIVNKVEYKGEDNV